MRTSQTMNKFLRKVRAQAHKNPKRIVYPEGTEERILRCTEEVLKHQLAQPILIGDPKIIKAKAKKLKLEIDWKNVEIIDQNDSKLTKEFATVFFELRKDKGITKAQANKIIKDINYFGTMMVHLNYADGMVTGTTFPTDDSIRPALQIIKTKEKFHKVSGVFFILLEKRLLLFADAAITINPEAHDLVDIAKDTAQTARRFGIEPKVAMLSFSTKGSADHPLVDKIKSAVAMLKDEEPQLIVDGELQVDAAIVPAVSAIKCPGSKLKGDANILIFPSLEAANIAYKLVERLAKAKAIGPILQGLKKPVNDLSRGCSYQDIVNVTAFTVCECQENPADPF